MYQGVIYRHYRITEDGFEKSYIGKHEGLNPEKNRWHKDGSGYKPRNNKGTTGEKLHWMYYDEWLETNKDLENKVENNK